MSAWWLLVTLAFAHEGGHGPKLEGLGPRGGRLSAVVRASEVDKGLAAPLSAVAEWVGDGTQPKLFLWTVDRKSLLGGEAAREVKLIVLRPKQKPEVRALTFKGYPWELPDVTGASVVELILQPMTGREREVVAFSLP